jgi:hypothetical protein
MKKDGKNPKQIKNIQPEKDEVDRGDNNSLVLDLFEGDSVLLRLQL